MYQKKSKRRSRRSTWAEQLKPRQLAPKEPLMVVLVVLDRAGLWLSRGGRPEANLRHFNLWIDLVWKQSMRHLGRWHQVSQNSVILLLNIKTLVSLRAPVRRSWLVKREINHFPFFSYSGTSRVFLRRIQKDDLMSVLLFQNTFHISSDLFSAAKWKVLSWFSKVVNQIRDSSCQWTTQTHHKLTKLHVCWT